MKKLTVAQKMRRTAGVLYAVLSAYQMLALNTIVQSAGFLSGAAVTWIAGVLLIPAAAALSIWMFGGDTVLGAGARRGVLVGTLLAVVFELSTYAEQTNAINYTLSKSLPALYGDANMLYAFVTLRFILLLLAAFFVYNCRDSLDYTGGAKKPAATGGKAAGKAARQAVSADDLDKPLDDLDKPLAVTKKKDKDKD